MLSQPTISLLSTGFILVAFGLIMKFAPSRGIAHFPAVPMLWTVLGMLKKLPFDEVLEYTTQLELVHRYKVIRAYFQGQWTLMVGCPVLAKQIYSNTASFPKLVPEHHQSGTIFSRLTGHSAFFSNEQAWREHRKTLLDPVAFTSYVSKKSLLNPEALCQIMGNMVKKIGFQSGEKLDALDLMQRVTFDCLSKQFLDKNFDLTCSKSNQLASSMLNIFDHAFTYGFTLLTTLFPLLQSKYNPFYWKVYKDVEQWESCLKQIITATRKTIEIEGPTSSDIVTKMIFASEHTEHNDEAILNNLKMLFLPSQSLPPALGAALHFLAQDSEIQSAAYQEIKSQVDSTSTFALTQSQINNMSYLNAIVKETLRLYPTLCPPPKRIASKDVTIGQHFIPKGTHLMIDTFAIQRDPSLWPDPTNFNPARFLGNTPSAYLPFAAGSRRCPGSQLVQDLMTNILANLISKYEIKYPSKTSTLKLKLKAQVILVPDNLILNFNSRS